MHPHAYTRLLRSDASGLSDVAGAFLQIADELINRESTVVPGAVGGDTLKTPTEASGDSSMSEGPGLEPERTTAGALGASSAQDFLQSEYCGVTLDGVTERHAAIQTDDCIIESGIVLFYVLFLVLLTLRWLELRVVALSSPPARAPPVHQAKKVCTWLCFALSAALTAALLLGASHRKVYVDLSWGLHCIVWAFSAVIFSMEYSRFLPQSWSCLRSFWLATAVEGAVRFVWAICARNELDKAWIEPIHIWLPSSAGNWVCATVALGLFLYSCLGVILACLSFIQPIDVPLELLPYIHRLMVAGSVNLTSPQRQRHGQHGWRSNERDFAPASGGMTERDRGDSLETVSRRLETVGEGSVVDLVSNLKEPPFLEPGISHVVLVQEQQRRRVHAEFKLDVRLMSPGTEVFRWGARKRYQNFAEMHVRVLQVFASLRYPSLFPHVPQLPPKAPFVPNPLDPNFLEDRRKGLDAYLSQLCRNSAFWIPEVLLFLDTPAILMGPLLRHHELSLVPHHAHRGRGGRGWLNDPFLFGGGGGVGGRGPLSGGPLLRNPSSDYSDASPLGQSLEASMAAHSPALQGDVDGEGTEGGGAGGLSVSATAAAAVGRRPPPTPVAVDRGGGDKETGTEREGESGARGAVRMVRTSLRSFRLHLGESGRHGQPPYVTYLVVTRTAGAARAFQALRRYSDFVALQQRLKDLTSAQLPRLPGKQATARKDFFFYETRRRQLQDWLQKLVEDCECHCKTLWAFLALDEAAARSVALEWSLRLYPEDEDGETEGAFAFLDPVRLGDGKWGGTEGGGDGDGASVADHGGGPGGGWSNRMMPPPPPLRVATPTSQFNPPLMRQNSSNGGGRGGMPGGDPWMVSTPGGGPGGHGRERSGSWIFGSLFGLGMRGGRAAGARDGASSVGSAKGDVSGQPGEGGVVDARPLTRGRDSERDGEAAAHTPQRGRLIGTGDDDGWHSLSLSAPLQSQGGPLRFGSPATPAVGGGGGGGARGLGLAEGVGHRIGRLLGLSQPPAQTSAAWGEGAERERGQGQESGTVNRLEERRLMGEWREAESPFPPGRGPRGLQGATSPSPFHTPRGHPETVRERPTSSAAAVRARSRSRSRGTGTAAAAFGSGVGGSPERVPRPLRSPVPLGLGGLPSPAPVRGGAGGVYEESGGNGAAGETGDSSDREERERDNLMEAEKPPQGPAAVQHGGETNVSSRPAESERDRPPPRLRIAIPLATRQLWGADRQQMPSAAAASIQQGAATAATNAAGGAQEFFAIHVRILPPSDDDEVDESGLGVGGGVESDVPSRARGDRAAGKRRVGEREGTPGGRGRGGGGRGGGEGGGEEDQGANEPGAIKSHRVLRTYKDFQELHFELSREFSAPGISLLPPLPQRTFAHGSGASRELDERTVRLEVYLQILTKHFETFECAALTSFLSEHVPNFAQRVANLRGGGARDGTSQGAGGAGGDGQGGPRRASGSTLSPAGTGRAGAASTGRGGGAEALPPKGKPDSTSFHVQMPPTPSQAAPSPLPSVHHPAQAATVSAALGLGSPGATSLASQSFIVHQSSSQAGQPTPMAQRPAPTAPPPRPISTADRARPSPRGAFTGPNGNDFPLPPLSGAGVSPARVAAGVPSVPVTDTDRDGPGLEQHDEERSASGRAQSQGPGIPPDRQNER